MLVPNQRPNAPRIQKAESNLRAPQPAFDTPALFKTAHPGKQNDCAEADAATRSGRRCAILSRLLSGQTLKIVLYVHP